MARVAHPFRRPPLTDPNPPTKPAVAKRTRLIESHLDLVARIARNIAVRLPPSFDFEDLRGAGYIGLCQAADRWDETRGVPFHYYAARRIRGQILEGVRRRHWVANTMHEISPEVLEMPGARAESIEAPIDIGVARKLLTQALGGLNETERTVFQVYYANHGQLRGIAEHFGVSQNKSSAMLQGVKRSMRRELAWRGVKKAA
jgi:RNA polymerase sigma factor (sigma-70 family)